MSDFRLFTSGRVRIRISVSLRSAKFTGLREFQPELILLINADIMVQHYCFKAALLR